MFEPYSNRKYEKGLGVYVGHFSEDDIRNGVDKREIKRAKEETGLKYTNTKIIRTNSTPVMLRVWVCTAEDFRI